MHAMIGGLPDLGPRASGLGQFGRAAIALLLVWLAACGGSTASQPTPPPSNIYRGMASWYGEPQMTASGERFDPRALTAAHRSLPLGTRVRVTNTHNGKSVVVRINDRGPYSHARIIDLSEAAAKLLDMIEAGVVPVVLEVLP
jgi:rare lipoprotein A (peptidoglycan hydrolase)